MPYAIIKVINGNYFIHAEGITTLEAAKSQFHGLCQMLWNAQDVIDATVEIVSSNLIVIDGYKEHIIHLEPEPEPEPEEE